MSALIAADEGGNFLSEDELLATCTILIQAGHETTANLISNGLLALLNHPDQLAQLRSDPSLAESAVEEILRYNGSVHRLKRTVTEDVEFGGKSLKKGQLVYLVMGSANRDPAVFSEPQSFNILRPKIENRHLAFGHGIHFCIGAPLARLEAPIALNAILARFSEIRLAEQPEPVENITRPVLKSLPVFL